MSADEKVCPDCAETVKAAANVCRFCGHQFKRVKAPSKRSPYQGPRNDKERKVARNSQIGCAVVVIALIIAVANCSSDAPPSQTASPTSNVQEDTSEAGDESPFDDTRKQSLWIVMSRDAIRSRLRDPESAEFRNLRFYSGGSVPVVCGEVNAKNAFGGYTGYERFIASGDNTDIAFLASDLAEGDSIDEAWDQLCVRADRDEEYVP